MLHGTRSRPAVPESGLSPPLSWSTPGLCRHASSISTSRFWWSSFRHDVEEFIPLCSLVGAPQAIRAIIHKPTAKQRGLRAEVLRCLVEGSPHRPWVTTLPLEYAYNSLPVLKVTQLCHTYCLGPTSHLPRRGEEGPAALQGVWKKARSLN